MKSTWSRQPSGDAAGAREREPGPPCRALPQLCPRLHTQRSPQDPQAPPAKALWTTLFSDRRHCSCYTQKHRSSLLKSECELWDWRKELLLLKQDLLILRFQRGNKAANGCFHKPSKRGIPNCLHFKKIQILLPPQGKDTLLAIFSPSKGQYSRGSCTAPVTPGTGLRAEHFLPGT